MKHFILAALMLALVSLAAVPGYDFAQAWKAQYYALKANQQVEIDRIEDQKEALRDALTDSRRTIAGLEREVARLASFETSQAHAKSLQTQIHRLSANVGSTQKELFEAQRQLQNVLSKVARIKTATATSGVFGCRRFYGTSMKPAFDSDDLVCIQEPPFSVKLSDIVIAPCSPSGFISFIHRIIGGNADGYILKGDNNPGPDPCRPTLADITWKVVAIAKDIYDDQ